MIIPNTKSKKHLHMIDCYRWKLIYRTVKNVNVILTRDKICT